MAATISAWTTEHIAATSENAEDGHEETDRERVANRELNSVILKMVEFMSVKSQWCGACDVLNTKINPNL